MSRSSNLNLYLSTLSFFPPNNFGQRRFYTHQVFLSYFSFSTNDIRSKLIFNELEQLDKLRSQRNRCPNVSGESLDSHASHTTR